MSIPDNQEPVKYLFTDRDLAIAIRAALLAIVDAIERRYNLKKKKLPN